MVERFLDAEEAVGSIPSAPTIIYRVSIHRDADKRRKPGLFLLNTILINE